MKGIDNNANAKDLLDNRLKKLDHFIRELYNMGYNTGFADGAREATEKNCSKDYGAGE